MGDIYAIGIDIGSTTAKIVVLDGEGNRIFGKYQRHFADVRKTLLELLAEVNAVIGDSPCTTAVTGSGGMNLAKHLDVPFIQEVIAVTNAVKAEDAGIDCVVELGGEDAKIIFMKNGIEQRMNGICAGGTGAFIDQMASLFKTDAGGLNELAKNYKNIYPIAARCGVFAKTDIQPLINDGVAREDLAASVFEAVVNQTISGLACGRKIEGKVVFLGGPLYFLSELQKAFRRILRLDEENAVFPENAHLFAAKGAAGKSMNGSATTISKMLQRLSSEEGFKTEMHCLPALFENEAAYDAFKERQSRYVVKKAELSEYRGNCFLGVDAGSTTFKLALVSEDGELLYSYYSNNQGELLSVAQNALSDLYNKLDPDAHIKYSCSTGYGEELLKNAFFLDEGEVETIAHFYAASYFEPEVSSIIDIGGQDMKCIRMKKGCIDSITLNEACSSGCGSFIENFANSLGYSAEEFASMAIKAKKPVDLGTRCTVFMNSNVKQAQKEGVAVEDIAAGLAYSVIKNALFKVIKLSDPSELGDKIVVQGGTFYSDAVLKSFEDVAGVQVIRPDISGIMGAFGAALIAKERWSGRTSSIISKDDLEAFTYETRSTRCQGCQNNCRLTVNLFANGKRYISGNRCEKGLGIQHSAEEKMPNLIEYKKERMFGYESLSGEEAKRGTIGIPRVLNIYENYPFWAVFFKELGFRVQLSPFSDDAIYKLGMDSIPSESECYPAKLAHGHVEWLIAQGVNTIFYPCVYYERRETKEAKNCYNCPMVISYPENIKNNLENIVKKNINFHNPFIAFSSKKVLKKTLGRFMKNTFGISGRELNRAIEAGWNEMLRAKEDVLEEGRKTLKWMEDNNRHGIVLAGRPYHADQGVNHGIPKMINDLGYPVLTEDSIAGLNPKGVKLRYTNQWTYHARLFDAAQYAATRTDLDLIQLNSFGCGVDAVTIDQVQELLEGSDKLYTLLKIDEVSNLGAAKIRVRSMIAAVKMRAKQRPAGSVKLPRDYHRPKFTLKMNRQKYTLLCTGMLQPHFDFLEAAMRRCKYDLVLMRNEGQNVLDMGLKYVNNDACYPTMIVTGQIMDEVLSGKYDTDHLGVFMVQTGGGCRASNYVAFIRKALQDAGYGHIPVISVSPNLMELNSGMIYTFTMGFKCVQALIYGDILMKVMNRMRPYELEKGTVDALFKKWHDICIEDIYKFRSNFGKFKKNCRNIIKEFDEIETVPGLVKPKVGIVGEVLVKYMPLANNHLSETLEAEGAEVVIPDFMDFLDYCFWNSIYRRKELGGGWVPYMIGTIAIWLIDGSRKNVNKALVNSKHFDKPTKLSTISEGAKSILQIGNQCGEGWYLAGEVVNLMKEGVPNVVCIQPFGCLPNHVVGKGIIKKVKELYPQSNIVAVDYDPSASKVNQLNRIKLMMEVANENIAKEESEE